ncbi:MAG: PD40 domain-containing protein [Bacteroidales bacterium]|nr:PD40 domain-containing protein [Bacteroidales bacterium]
MKFRVLLFWIPGLLTLLVILSGCTGDNFSSALPAGHEPVIEPDYSGVTVPPNIAPLNFLILEKGKSFRRVAKAGDNQTLTLTSSNGEVRFPVKKWKELLKGTAGGKIEIEIIASDNENSSLKFKPVQINVAAEQIDPYLCYRLLYPGYRSWVDMKIVQRSLEDFNEESLFENQMMEQNCVNCHTFRQNSPDIFLLHVRGSKGGTYFYDGRKLTRTSLKTKEMTASAVYPSWHPSGRFVAFSSNKTVQSFHMRPEKNIEVYDLYSSLVIYDLQNNEIFACPEKDTVKYMETFPCWSPDGNYLYYCRASQVKEGFDYLQVKYDLVRKRFDQASGIFGNTEIVFNAMSVNKSVSLPVISPDGKYLVFTLHDYGTFSIWHKEADLYLLDLQSGETNKMSLNSDATESYHSWSSNGKWLVFSSKRGDGLTARPYFSYFISPDSSGKPFVLPQEDPTLYRRLKKTFNRPELITGRINIGPRDFARAADANPVKPVWTVKEK